MFKTCTIHQAIALKLVREENSFFYLYFKKIAILPPPKILKLLKLNLFGAFETTQSAPPLTREVRPPLDPPQLACSEMPNQQGENRGPRAFPFTRCNHRNEQITTDDNESVDTAVI